jgi:hypothetical protein
MPSLGLNVALPYIDAVLDVIIGPGAGALLMEDGFFFLLEDGTSHFLFE